MGRSLHLHIDRRRMAVLGVAGAFLVIAIVFGGLAYFRVTPQPGRRYARPRSGDRHVHHVGYPVGIYSCFHIGIWY